MEQKELLKSVTSKDASGKEVRYSVEQIENGYVLTQDVNWKDAKGNYQYKTLKRFYKENPLDEKAIKFDPATAKGALDINDND